MRALAFAALIGISGLLLTGCGGSKGSGQKEPMDLKNVPPEIMKVAREQLPGVTFDEASREANGSYELRGKSKNGKAREIDIRPDGTVEEID